MKMTYGIIALIIVLGISTYFFVYHRVKTNEVQSSVKEYKLDENPYNDLRSQAFSVTKEQLELTDNNELFGLIMDWELGEGTMTLITFRTGDASMYLSSGGGVIGGGQHENVRIAVANYLDTAEQFLKSAEQVEHSNLPGTDSANFYFLTTNGRFLLAEDIENFENESSEIYQLFSDANIVISELRMTTEK